MGQPRHKKILKQAAEDNVISYQQCLALMLAFDKEDRGKKIFSFSNVLFYFGGFLAIAAVSIFMSLSFASFQEVGLFCSASAVFAGAFYLTRHYIAKDLRVPAGIVATFAVTLVPFIVYCLYVMFGLTGDDYQNYHRFVKWQWVMMELVTLATAAIMLYVYRLPFMMFAVTVTLWYFSMDFSLLMLGQDYWDYDLRKAISMLFGVLMVIMAIYIDGRSYREDDYAFWPYLFGVTCFWLALTTQVEREIGPLTLYFILNLAFFILGALLKRKVFVVFAAMGSLYYLGYLSSHVFTNTLIFSLALIGLGMLMIKFGLLWQEYQPQVEKALRGSLPEPVNRYLDALAK